MQVVVCWQEKSLWSLFYPMASQPLHHMMEVTATAAGKTILEGRTCGCCRHPNMQVKHIISGHWPLCRWWYVGVKKVGGPFFIQWPCSLCITWWRLLPLLLGKQSNWSQSWTSFDVSYYCNSKEILGKEWWQKHNLPCGPSMKDYPETSGNLRKPAVAVSGRFSAGFRIF